MTGKISFRKIYKQQTTFQGKIEKMLTHDNPTKFHYHMTAMTEELGELLKADKRWKTHRNSTYNQEEKLDELADVFITAMNISLWSGFSYEQLANSISNKIETNNNRLDKER